MKKTVAIVFILVAFSLLCTEAGAQCAMCKQVAESATENENPGIGEGLNSGIVYLMAAPYLLLGTVAIVFFRKRITSVFRS
jgi:hypothetical protein